MSDDSIPAPNGQHKPVIVMPEDARMEIMAHLMFASEAKPFSPETMRWLLPPCEAHKVSDEMVRLMANSLGRVHFPIPDESPPNPPAKPKRRREDRKSGLWAVVHAAREFGFTPPSEGFWVMLPKEYDAILALEPKAVAQVVLEVLRQTIGTVERLPDGRAKRKEWGVGKERCNFSDRLIS
jgi:hypothetical protein